MEAGGGGAGTGPTVLDIGGDVGAVTLRAGEGYLGREVEIRISGRAWDGRHVAFHRRQTTAGTVVAAVFPQLREGDWEVRLLGDDSSPVVPVHVTGGRVGNAAYPA